MRTAMTGQRPDGWTPAGRDSILPCWPLRRYAESMTVRGRIAIALLLIVGLILGPMTGMAGTAQATDATPTTAETFHADAQHSAPGDPCPSDHHDTESPCFLGSGSCGGCVGATGTAPVTAVPADVVNARASGQLAAAHNFRDPKPPRTRLG